MYLCEQALFEKDLANIFWFFLQYDEFKLTRYPAFTMLVFIVFMFIMPILLLNMLIAMMASTFESIIQLSEKAWILQWAKIVIILEQTFSADDLLRYREVYSIVPSKVTGGKFI